MISRLVPRAEPTSASTVLTSRETSTTFIDSVFQLTGVPAAIAIIIFISILSILLILLLIAVGVKTYRRHQKAKKPRYRFGVAAGIDSGLSFDVLGEKMAGLDGAGARDVEPEEELSYDLEKNTGEHIGMQENMRLEEYGLYSGFAETGLDPEMQQSYLTRHSTKAQKQIPPPSLREGSLGQTVNHLPKRGSSRTYSPTLAGVAQSQTAPGTGPKRSKFQMPVVPDRSYDGWAGRDDGNWTPY
jgi:hypothetical protein